MNQDNNHVEAPAKVPLHLKRNEPRYEVTTDANGLTVSTPTRQSPFPREVLLQLRTNAVLREQIERGRPLEYLEHKEYMRYKKPIIEETYKVSGAEIFRKGNAIEAARLMKEDKAAYEELREAMFFA